MSSSSSYDLCETIRWSSLGLTMSSLSECDQIVAQTTNVKATSLATSTTKALATRPRPVATLQSPTPTLDSLTWQHVTSTLDLQTTLTWQHVTTTLVYPEASSAVSSAPSSPRADFATKMPRMSALTIGLTISIPMLFLTAAVLLAWLHMRRGWLHIRRRSKRLSHLTGGADCELRQRINIDKNGPHLPYETRLDQASVVAPGIVPQSAAVVHSPPRPVYFRTVYFRTVSEGDRNPSRTTLGPDDSASVAFCRLRPGCSDDTWPTDSPPDEGPPLPPASSIYEGTTGQEQDLAAARGDIDSNETGGKDN